MPDQMPPARRRPTSAGASSTNRAAPRRTGPQRASAAASMAPAEPRGEPGAKLICTAGPKAGTEFPLLGEDEIIVGRATENAVSIPDTSVSRRHCSIRRTDGGWEITDLGSGNGTLLNGERIEAETVLGNGDVITIGDTELQFEDAANATAAHAVPTRRSADRAPVRRSTAGRPDVRARLSRSGAPAVDPAKRKKMLIIGGAVAGVVMIGLIGLKVMANKQRAREEAEAAQLQQMRQELGAIFQDGKNLVREGKWAEAKAKFEEVQQRNPNYPAVGDYLNRANIEIPNAEHLAKAETALGANKLAEAAAELKQVSSDTQQFEKLRELKSKLDKSLDKRLAEATELMNTSGEKDERRAAYVRAQEITDDILKMSPDNRDAQTLNASAQEQIKIIDTPAPVVVGPKPKPWEPVIARYTAGDVTGSLAMADDCAGRDRKCRDLAKQIREVANLNKRAEDLDARSLTKLLSLDRGITGGEKSRVVAGAATRAANIFYKNASAAKAAGQWGRAVEWAQKALSADPNHQGAKAVVSEVRSKAHDQYLQCYSLKETNPDEAVNCFRTVLQMTPAGDENHEKAESWIKKLEAR